MTAMIGSIELEGGDTPRYAQSVDCPTGLCDARGNDRPVLLSVQNECTFSPWVASF